MQLYQSLFELAHNDAAKLFRRLSLVSAIAPRDEECKFTSAKVKELAAKLAELEPLVSAIERDVEGLR